MAQFNLAVTPNHPLEQLSGGQQTRAMLASLLFKQPDFILLDEPTNNLDQQGREAVVNLLAQWQGSTMARRRHHRQL